MSEEVYVLEMDRETAAAVKRACDLYSRLLVGQFDVLPFEIMMAHPDMIKAQDITNRKMLAEDALERARRIMFPELTYPRQSYGVGHCREADTAWNACQAVRYSLAYQAHPEGGISVDFNRPVKLSDAPMPKCRVVEEGNKDGN